jgi:hypothetical protein
LVRLADLGEGELEGAAGDGLTEVADAVEGQPEFVGVDAVAERLVDGVADGPLALGGGAPVLLPPFGEELVCGRQLCGGGWGWFFDGSVVGSLEGSGELWTGFRVAKFRVSASKFGVSGAKFGVSSADTPSDVRGSWPVTPSDVRGLGTIL